MADTAEASGLAKSRWVPACTHPGGRSQGKEAGKA